MKNKFELFKDEMEWIEKAYNYYNKSKLSRLKFFILEEINNILNELGRKPVKGFGNKYEKIRDIHYRLNTLFDNNENV